MTSDNQSARLNHVHISSFKNDIIEGSLHIPQTRSRTILQEPSRSDAMGDKHCENAGKSTKPPIKQAPFQDNLYSPLPTLPAERDIALTPAQSGKDFVEGCTVCHVPSLYLLSYRRNMNRQVSAIPFNTVHSLSSMVISTGPSQYIPSTDLHSEAVLLLNFRS